VSGHYHFRHSTDEALVRPDGTARHGARRTSLKRMGQGAVGPLDAQTLSVETWTVDPDSARVNNNTLHTKPTALGRPARRPIARSANTLSARKSAQLKSPPAVCPSLPPRSLSAAAAETAGSSRGCGRHPSLHLTQAVSVADPPAVGDECGERVDPLLECVKMAVM
jgi:hypothetical protein